MNIEQILRSREIRSANKSRPFRKFFKLYDEVLAINNLDNNVIPENIIWLLEKHAVITMVTAVEIYFRESLDLIFRTCKPIVFEKQLKDIHKNKYDIEEVITLYKKRINPLELVIEGCNFQNFENITSVFSKILGKSLWDTVLSMQLRLEEKPDNELSATSEDFDSFKKVLSMRHELIHNPDLSKTKLTEQEMLDLHSVSLLILFCDVVFNNFINNNLDDELRKKNA